MVPGPHIGKAVIVGGGIMGLSVAWGLVRAGWRVELLERGDLPDRRASSHDRSRLIRQAYGRRTGYMTLVADAHAAWQQLWDDLGAVHYVETGALMLDTADAGWARDSAAAMAAAGLAVERLDAGTVADRWPIVRPDGLAGAWLCPRAGVLYADRILTGLVDWLQAAGAVLLPHTPAVAVDPVRARAETAQGWTADGDLLVLCAGPWTGRLLPERAAGLTPSRQLVLYLEPPLDTVLAWRDAPILLDIASDSGCYIVPPTAGAPLKLGDHRIGAAPDAADPGATNPDAGRRADPAAVRRLIATAGTRLADIERYRPTEARTCFYTLADDERFQVEPLGPRAWMLAGFSGHGFKFGPWLGTALAAAIGAGSDPATSDPATSDLAAALSARAAGHDPTERTP